MKATTLEFRYRFYIFIAIYTLGITAPWSAALHLDGTGPNTHLWARLAMLLYRNCGLHIGPAFNIVLIAGILAAAAGAFLRTWASASISASVMRDPHMRSDSVVANGPYRYLRNPLYLGLFLFTFALTLLMPPSGAAFTLIASALFQLRLIFSEEAFLTQTLGQPYTAYLTQVPRLIPALHPQVAATTARPNWLEGILAEIFLWCVTLSFAILGWQYDAHLLLRAVLVSLGISLIARAFTPKPHPTTASVA